jgi:hypothetical protein
MTEQEIVIVFENCEAESVSEDQVAFLHIAGITESITFSPHGGLIKSKTAESLHMGIHAPSLGLVARCQKYKDITQIVMDDTTYHIKWEGDSDYENPNQSVCLRSGVLDIVVRQPEVWEFD